MQFRTYPYYRRKFETKEALILLDYRKIMSWVFSLPTRCRYSELDLYLLHAKLYTSYVISNQKLHKN